MEHFSLVLLYVAGAFFSWALTSSTVTNRFSAAERNVFMVRAGCRFSSRPTLSSTTWCTCCGELDMGIDCKLCREQMIANGLGAGHATIAVSPQPPMHVNYLSFITELICTSCPITINKFFPCLMAQYVQHNSICEAFLLARNRASFTSKDAQQKFPLICHLSSFGFN